MAAWNAPSRMANSMLKKVKMRIAAMANPAPAAAQVLGCRVGKQVLPEGLAFLHEDEVHVGFFVAPGVEDAGCAAQFFKGLAA